MEKSLEKIRDALKKAEAGNLFGDPTEDLVIACKEFLKERGYKISEPFNYTYKNVNSIDRLIEFFYDLHKRFHRFGVVIYRSAIDEDRAIAKKFVQSRMELSDFDEKTALKECAEIINTVFEFEKEFKFEMPLTFSIFGHSKMLWVSKKAVQLLNDREKLRNERKTASIHDEIDRKYDKEDVGYSNLDEILERIKQHP